MKMIWNGWCWMMMIMLDDPFPGHTWFINGTCIIIFINNVLFFHKINSFGLGNYNFNNFVSLWLVHSLSFNRPFFNYKHLNNFGQCSHCFHSISIYLFNVCILVWSSENGYKKFTIFLFIQSRFIFSEIISLFCHLQKKKLCIFQWKI